MGDIALGFIPRLRGINNPLLPIMRVCICAQKHGHSRLMLVLSSLRLHIIIIIIAVMMMMTAGAKSRASDLGAGVLSLSYSPSPSALGFESMSSLNLEPAVGCRLVLPLCLTFTWVFRIQTKVFTFILQVLYPPRACSIALNTAVPHFEGNIVLSHCVAQPGLNLVPAEAPASAI